MAKKKKTATKKKEGLGPLNIKRLIGSLATIGILCLIAIGCLKDIQSVAAIVFLLLIAGGFIAIALMIIGAIAGMVILGADKVKAANKWLRTAPATAPPKENKKPKKEATNGRLQKRWGRKRG